MPNVKPSLINEKLKYNVTMGLVTVIKIPGVTRDVKDDGRFEKITVEHLTGTKEYVTIFESEDLFENAFTFRV